MNANITFKIFGILENQARSSHTNSAMGQCTRWLEILDDLPASAGGDLYMVPSLHPI